MTTTSNLDAILKKTQSLVNLAEDEGATPAEAANARAKAEAMMRKYRVEEQTLADAQPELGLVPIVRTMDLAPMSTAYRNTYFGMLYWICEHAGVRVPYNLNHDSERRMWTIKVVGYESDIRFAEILYTSARVVFGARLEPQVNPELSDEENVYRLRSAGIERGRIAEIMWGVRGSKPVNIKVTKLYKRACLARGEDAAVVGRRVNAKTFRKEYASQFVSTLYMRLSAARNAADSPAGTLVLASRKDKVDDAFYEQFPHLRPTPADPNAEPVKQRKPRQTTTKQMLAYWEREENPAVQAGRRAGRSAAEQVDLSSTVKAKRLEDEGEWVDRTFREMTS